MSDRKTDSQGRQFIALHDVRGALVTASATLTTGTAQTLIAGDTDYFLDLIEVSFANNSGSAQVLLTNDGTTICTVQAGAGTTQMFFDAGLTQNTKNTPWLADLEDITGSSIVVNATFIKKLM